MADPIEIQWWQNCTLVLPPPNEARWRRLLVRLRLRRPLTGQMLDLFASDQAACVGRRREDGYTATVLVSNELLREAPAFGKLFAENDVRSAISAQPLAGG